MTHEFPVIIASKIRARFNYAMLPLGLRLRIKTKPHPRGIYMKPMDPTDAEAVEWVRDQAAQFGVLVWRHTGHGPHARNHWVKKIPVHLEKL